MGRAPQDKGGATKLVAVKAVSDGYPLRGRLKLRNTPGAPERDGAGAPEPGTAWVDASLLDALQLKMGDTLLLGDAALKIARIIAIEPDRGAGFMSFAPRVMVGHGDLAVSGLIQPASRVNYRLAVASPASRDAEVSAFVRWTEEQIAKQALRGVRVESMESGRPEMKQTLDRAEKFLNLVALLAALLARGASADARTPLVLDSPHSGFEMPADFASVRSAQELRDGEDCFIDELYLPATARGVPLLAAQFPRTYIDANRHAADIDPVGSETDYASLLAEIVRARRGRHYFNPMKSLL